MLTFKQMVYKGAKGPNAKDIMWKSIEGLSCYIEGLWRTNPREAHKLMLSQWEIMFGPHYDGPLSREEVNEMHHTGPDGEEVVGELITVEEASSRVPAEKRELLMWDAYVAFNGFAHDLAHANLSKAQIMDAATSFWLKDDDFPDKDGKIWWYYKNL